MIYIEAGGRGSPGHAQRRVREWQTLLLAQKFADVGISRLSEKKHDPLRIGSEPKTGR